MLSLVAAAVALAMLPSGGSAAGITWGTPKTISVDTDVSTNGVPLYAYDESNAGAVVNTVSFNAGNSTTALGANVSISGISGGTYGGFGASGSPWSGLSSSYQTVLAGAAYGGTGAGTITLNNLVVGHNYVVQVWVDDSRTYGAGRNETNSSYNTVVMNYNSTGAQGGVGQYTIGTFTANATNQAFTLQANSNAGSTQINAIQVRDTTAMTTTSGVWTNTAGGLWNTAANWTNHAVAYGAGSTADFSKVNLTSDSTVTLDAPLIIGNLIFGNTDANPAANWTITDNSAGYGLQLAGASPTITVNNLGAGESATITPTISGSASLTKTGPGTLTLSANNIYTGGTVVSNGVLVLANGYGPGCVINSLNIYSGAIVSLAAGDALGYDGGLSVTNVTVYGGLLTNIYSWAWNSYFASYHLSGGTVDSTPGGVFSFAGASGLMIESLSNNVQSAFNAGINLGAGFILKAAAGSVPGGVDLNINGVMQGGNGFTKTGPGVVQLSAANTYAGPTIVSAGTLMVSSSGSIANSTVTVQTNATLGGNGSVAGPVTVQAGGTLRVGTTNLDALTINNTLALAGKIVFNLSKTGGSLGNDRLQGLTSVSYGGTLTVSNLTSDGTLLASGDSFQLFPSGILYSGGFAAYTLPTLPTGLSWDLTQLGVSGVIQVVNTAATPVFNPPGGGYIGARTVTISSTTPGVTIHYTTNGTSWLTGSSGVTVSVPVPTANLSISAYATASGFAASGTNSATYSTLPKAIWTNPLGGSWATAGNWSNNVIGQGVGATADFSTLALSSGASVSLDAPWTIGNLVFADQSGSNNTWELNNGTWTGLTLASTNGVSVISNSSPTTIDALLTGTNNLTKTGTNVLTVTAQNTYSGGTVVSNGILAQQNYGLPAPAVVVGSQGVLEYDSSVGSVSQLLQNLSGTGTVLITGGGTVTFGTGAGNTINWGLGAGAVIEVTNGTTAVLGTYGNDNWNSNQASLNVDSSSTVRFVEANGCVDALNGGGTITAGYFGSRLLTVGVAGGSGNFAGTLANDATSSGAALQLTKTGAGTQILSGPDTYTGITTISNGTIQVGSASTFTGTGPLGLANSGVFDLHGYPATVTDIPSSVNTATITDNSAGAGTNTLTIGAGTYGSQSSSCSALIEDGPNKVVAVQVANNDGATQAFNFNAPNTFSGGVTLRNTQNGTRYNLWNTITTVGSPGAIVSSPFGRGPITVGQASTDLAQLFFNGTPNNTLVNDVVVNTALGTDVPGTFRIATTGITLAGKITANLASATFDSGANTYGQVTLAGQITGASGLTCNSENPGWLAVTLANTNPSAPNNYNGDTVIQGPDADLHLGAAQQIPSGPGNGNVQLDGYLDLNGYNQTINGLNGAGSVNGDSGAPTFTVGGNNADGSFSGLLQNLDLVKIGSGGQILGGANILIVNLSVTSGTLELVNPVLSGSSRVTLVTGGVLQLDFAGQTNAVENLTLNGVAQAPGVYNSGNSASLITGGGSLLVMPKNMITLTPATVYQQIYGIGGNFAPYTTNSGDEVALVQYGLTNQVFSPQGLNLSFIRLGNTYDYGYAAASNTVAANNTIMQSFKAMQPNGKISMSAWSPPGYLKNNGVPYGGTLSNSSGNFAYTAYGNWWLRSMQYCLSNCSIVPDYVSIQNEPDFNPGGTDLSCAFDVTQDANAGYSNALSSVYASFQANGFAGIKLIGPEVSGLGGSKVPNYLNKVNISQISAVAHHCYQDNVATTGAGLLSTLEAEYPTTPKLMTELNPGDIFGTNEPDYMGLAQTMHNVFTLEQANTYMVWSVMWGLIYPPTGLPISDNYYVMGHFSKYINANDWRVAASSANTNVLASAYRHYVNGTPTAQLMVVMINSSSNYATVTLNTSNLWASAPSQRSWAVYKTANEGSSTFRLTLLDSASGSSLTNQNEDVGLAPYSLATAIINTAPAPSSTNASLAALSISPAGALTPAFSSATFAYAATNSYTSSNAVLVTATAVDTNASLKLSLNGGAFNPLTSGVASGPQNLRFVPPTNTLTVLVTAQNTVFSNLYTVNLTVQPSQQPFQLSNSLVGGTNLALAWPYDHTGYRLLMQTNKLNLGVSGNPNDWAAVPGTTATNFWSAPLRQTNAGEFYRLVYP